MKRLSLKIFTICLVLFSTTAFAIDSKQYNIYLVLSDQAKTYITDFNKTLKNDDLLEKYNVTPFADNHPIHLTLYLTSFHQNQLSNIENTVSKIAAITKIFDIQTSNFTANKSGFVMLGVTNNDKLQSLSNQVIDKLSPYRNKNYPMPTWVQYFPEKQKSFEKYGSPNAYTQFDPDLSILATSLNNENMTSFVDDFNIAINNFKNKPITANVKSIGIGEVDNYGQVTKVIKTYNLQK